LAIVGLVIAFGIASRVDPLSLGSVAARALGVDADRVTQYALVAVVLLVAPGVTVVGIIAFVGLVVPHALRLFLGPRNTFLLPASAVFGGLLVASADFISRNMLAPAEIPVGAVTALVGAPVFLVLLRQMVRRGVMSI
jgi:iron complex transport system permease protein